MLVAIGAPVNDALDRSLKMATWVALTGIYEDRLAQLDDHAGKIDISGFGLHLARRMMRLGRTIIAIVIAMSVAMLPAAGSASISTKSSGR